MSGMKKALLAGIAAIWANAAPAQDVQYFQLDAVGSVRAVTDANGNVIERHDYLPFGEECTTGPCASNPGAGGGQPRKFTAKERDSETGLDYFGARYYGSKIGRFTTGDPAMTIQANLVDPQRWNRYAYARNNPLRYTDPDGKIIFDWAQFKDNLSLIGASGVGLDIKALAVLASAGSVANDALLLTGVGEAAAAIRAGLGATAGEIGAAAGKAAILRANSEAGAAFEDAVAAAKASEQTGIVRQVTVETESGIKTRLDLVGRDASGSVRLTEAKASETARLTPNQRTAFPEIAETGCTVCGQGKPGFPGGTRIPPTNVEIVRPSNLGGPNQ